MERFINNILLKKKIPWKMKFNLNNFKKKKKLEG